MGLFDRFKKKKSALLDEKPAEPKAESKVSDTQVKAAKPEKKPVRPVGGSEPVKIEPVEVKKVDQKVKPSKKTEVKTEKDDKKKDFSYAPASRIILRPIISEKSTNLADGGKYVFEVSRKTNKVEIKKAVMSIYGVEPASVNMVSLKGKRKSFGRIQGRRKDWKKAIVTLKPGETIEVYEGV